jgi:2'-hydroxyisoflavone reductase
MGACLEGIRDAVGSDARFTWAAEQFLIDRGVEPWMGLPLWIPAAEGGLQDLDISAARAAGLRFRPLAETARDTLAWDLARPGEARAASPALQAEREAELLVEWAARP